MTKNEQIIYLKIQLGLCQAEYEKEHANLHAAKRLLLTRQSVAKEMEILIKHADRLMKRAATFECEVKELRHYAQRLEDVIGKLKQRPACMDAATRAAP